MVSKLSLLPDCWYSSRLDWLGTMLSDLQYNLALGAYSFITDKSVKDKVCQYFDYSVESRTLCTIDWKFRSDGVQNHISKFILNKGRFSCGSMVFKVLQHFVVLTVYCVCVLLLWSGICTFNILRQIWDGYWKKIVLWEDP